MSIVFERDPWGLTPRVSPETYPLIKAFDVHGCPERPGAVSPERAAVEAQAPPEPWLRRAINLFVLPFEWLTKSFHPRPRLRIVKES